jgi:hypothetical protein
MKRTLLSGIVALALAGASFGQAGNQGTPNPTGNQGKSTEDPTALQKGNADPTEQTKQQKDDEKKKGKDKTGKNKKGPIDPKQDDPAKGNGPTVPNPTTTNPPATR